MRRGVPDPCRLVDAQIDPHGAGGCPEVYLVETPTKRKSFQWEGFGLSF
jgi:hypothetical protein